MMVRCMCGVFACLLISFVGCQQEVANDSPDQLQDKSPEVTVVEPVADQFKKTQSLFDGQSLDGWELTEFGGEGDVSVEDGCIVMYSGDPITAINLPESFELPTVNYEIQYEAMKVEGTDFFGTITFPVGDSFCALVG